MTTIESKAIAVRHERIDDAAAGQRIDNYLMRIAKGVPKSHVYRILRSGEVRVNGRRVQQTYRLQEGDEVRIPPVRVAEPAQLRVEVRADEARAAGDADVHAVVRSAGARWWIRTAAGR